VIGSESLWEKGKRIIKKTCVNVRNLGTGLRLVVSFTSRLLKPPTRGKRPHYQEAELEDKIFFTE